MLRYGFSPFRPQVDQSEILKSRVGSLQKTQDATCRGMLNSLTAAELETAARASYHYFIAADSVELTENSPSKDERHKCAMRMARRHLIAEKGNLSLALNKMKLTINYRDKINVDMIRRCFTGTEYKNDDEREIRGVVEKGLKKELSDGKHFIRGHDNEKRSLFCLFPRRYESFDAKWYLLAKIYTLERALAYTERISGGREEKVNVIFDYQQYTSKNEPPLALIKALLFCLRDHYPERLRFLCFIDAPFMFRAFWTLIQPFIDPVTKKKIRFISGRSQKRKFFASIISENQAMSFILPNGKKPDEYNIENYLHNVPFDHDMDGN